MKQSTLKEDLYFEKIELNHTEFPIRIFEKKSDSTYEGCSFHWHQQIEFYIILEGSLKLNVGGEEKQLYAGDIGYVSWGKPHRGSNFCDGTKHYIIQIDLNQIPLFNRYPIFIQPSHHIPSFIEQDFTLLDLFKQIIWEYSSQYNGYDLEILASFFKIFSYLLRVYGSNINYLPYANDLNSLPHIYSILQYLNTHYKENLKLDSLASHLGLSKSYMCRIFKKHLNQTIITYINEQKCYLAASLINSGTSLQRVCEEVGFEDYNYFSRTFKNIMGHSPSYYLKK